MLTRIDGHSCIVNRKTFAWLDLSAQTEGVQLDAGGVPTGKLSLSANWQAQSAFFAALPIELKRAAEKRATDLALSHGALHLHAQLVGFKRDEYACEIDALRALPAKWYPKICEPDPELAYELGLPFIGGDVFLDGSIGSCTAAVTEPFLIAVDGGKPGNGSLKYSDEELYAYFAKAEKLGISAGVHAIGDRAIEQCIATWERVLDRAPRSNTRHFIEHFEIARPDHIERCINLGIYLSMQPQFDALWGGQGRMYDRRLGTERMRSMNALGRIQAAGGALCGGDDSPVCRLDPLAGMQAAAGHHEPTECLSPQQALTMYTYNAARLGQVETETGILAPGYAADFVLLDRDPLDGAHFSDCTVLQTWSNGTRVF
nr:amidohydrolase family protein [Candidatus Eremiobacteraeota bacterium]